MGGRTDGKSQVGPEEMGLEMEVDGYLESLPRSVVRHFSMGSWWGVGSLNSWAFVEMSVPFYIAASSIYRAVHTTSTKLESITAPVQAAPCKGRSRH